MINFIFWNNLNGDAFDIRAIESKLRRPDNAQSPIQRSDIGRDCGLIYSSSNSFTPWTAQNDNALVMCPSGSLHYKDQQNQGAVDRILDEYSAQGRFQPAELKGKFSLILLNKKNGAVSAFIDRFGVERLFYTTVDNAILLGNCLAGLTAAYPEKLTISSQAIYNYISAHVIPSPLTIYDHIFKLEPAHSITHSRQGIEKDIYWLPTFNETERETTGLQDETRQALGQAVKRCGITETTAAFLSGGLDSSTVAGYLAKLSDRAVSTYTMGFEEAGYDETEYARLAAKHFGTELRSYYVTPDDVADAFTHVVTGYDEPFGNSSAIPAYLCARFAQTEGVTTLLAGDGGDEIFAGNERYAKQQLFERYQHIPALARKGLLEPLLLNSLPYTRCQPFSKAKSYIEQAIAPMPDRMERYNFINHFDAKTIFAPDFLSHIDQEMPIRQKREVYFLPHDASMLNRMLYLDWKFTLADNDLVKVGSACRLANVDVRYPMLDDELVELSTQVPSSLKMQNRELRAFYKNCMKGFLPDEIINKKKHGFGLPFGEWLKKSPTLQEHMYDNLATLKQRHYVAPEFIDRIINIHKTQAAASYYGTMVWILSVLQEWLESKKL